MVIGVVVLPPAKLVPLLDTEVWELDIALGGERGIRLVLFIHFGVDRRFYPFDIFLWVELACEKWIFEALFLEVRVQERLGGRESFVGIHL